MDAISRGKIIQQDRLLTLLFFDQCSFEVLEDVDVARRREICPGQLRSSGAIPLAKKSQRKRVSARGRRRSATMLCGRGRTDHGEHEQGSTGIFLDFPGFSADFHGFLQFFRSWSCLCLIGRRVPFIRMSFLSLLQSSSPAAACLLSATVRNFEFSGTKHDTGGGLGFCIHITPQRGAGSHTGWQYGERLLVDRHPQLAVVRKRGRMGAGGIVGLDWQ